MWAFRGTFFVVGAAIVMSMVSCDKEGRRQCAWVIEPEPSLINRVQPGDASLCARNRTTMKQDRRLAAPVDFAKRLTDKEFRYVDMKIASPGLPRQIVEIRFCDGTVEKRKVAN